MTEENIRIQREVAFEREVAGLVTLRADIEQIKHWGPAQYLEKMIVEREQALEHARQRLNAKLVIAVVGPTGCGKSTLVNALVGKDDLVCTGVNRPTTRKIEVVARTIDDPRQVLDQLSHSDLVSKHYSSTLLPDSILLDTPDTDSEEASQHLDLLERSLKLTDVLICVFDATNPKRRDHIEALAKWVNFFPGEQVYLVLNRCDRIPKDDLDEVREDFQKHISQSWDRNLDQVFSVSGRSALHDPDWPEGEEPLHDLNELDKLRKELKTLCGGAFFVDHRIDRARHLRESMERVVQEKAELQKETLVDVQAAFSGLEREVSEEILKTLRIQENGEDDSLIVLLYGGLKQRWWGPVGVFICIWRRFLAMRTPFRQLRSIDPFSLTFGLWRSFAALRNPEKFERELLKMGSGTSESLDCTGAHIILGKKWPDIADRLVASGFSPAVRDPAMFLNLARLMSVLKSTWGHALKKATDAAAERLSRPQIQWMLNAPSLAGLSLIAFLLMREFFRKAYLPPNFFLHAFFLLVLIWLLCSFALQALVHRNHERIFKEALKHAKGMVGENVESTISASQGIASEVDRVIRLSRRHAK